MSESAHHDTSRNWLIFFFVCFALSIFGIGLWARFFYDVKEDTQPPGGSGGGGHSMIAPADGDWAPYAARYQAG